MAAAHTEVEEDLLLEAPDGVVVVLGVVLEAEAEVALAEVLEVEVLVVGAQVETGSIC